MDNFDGFDDIAEAIGDLISALDLGWWGLVILIIIIGLIAGIILL